MNSTLANSTLSEDSSNGFALFTLLRSSFVIQFLLGFPLNCYITYIILSKSGGVDVSLVFVLNHSGAEIVLSISSLLFLLLMDDPRYFVIKLMDFVFVVSMSARVLFLCCMSFERYLAVVHPVTFLRFNPLRYRVACSVLGWMCVVMLSICTSLSSFSVLVAVYIVSVVFEFFCCASVLRTLRHPGPRDREREQWEMSAAKKKAFQIICINLLTCLIQNIPVAVSFSLEHTLSDYDFWMAAAISTAINNFMGFVQPVFFLHRTGKLSFIKCT